MPNADCVSIREYVSTHPDRKIGPIVFRLTYKDDIKWAQFVDYLNKTTRDRLERYGDGDLFPHIDWSVQDDPSFEGFRPDQVRKHFRRIVEHENSGHDPDVSWAAYPRHMAYVAVDERDLDSVMKDVNEPDGQVEWGSVWLVSVNRKEIVHGRNEDGDSCIKVSKVFPRVYSLLELGWEAALDP